MYMNQIKEKVKRIPRNRLPRIFKNIKSKRQNKSCAQMGGQHQKVSLRNGVNTRDWINSVQEYDYWRVLANTTLCTSVFRKLLNQHYKLQNLLGVGKVTAGSKKA